MTDDDERSLSEEEEEEEDRVSAEGRERELHCNLNSE